MKLSIPALALFGWSFLLVLDNGAVLSMAATYHVSASAGDDAWPGTEALPWKTLGKVSSLTFQAGDQVLLRCGDTWSGEELILNGNGDAGTGSWIMLSSYGTGARPRITNPPYDLTPGLVDWSAINAAYPGTDRYYMKIAIKIASTFGGWTLKGLEIDTAEMGIYSTPEYSQGHITVEDCHIHDIDGLKMPKTPTWDQDTIMWSPFPVPAWGSAIDVNGDYLTVRDVVIERATGGIGSFVQGGVVENVYVDKVWSGGISLNGLSVLVRDSTVLNAQWPDGAWFGVDPFILGSCTDYRVERCEIAYTHIYETGGDAAGIDFDQGNVGCVLRDCFIHDNYGPGVEFHLAGENHDIHVDRNVFLANGYEVPPELGYEEPTFSIDAQVFTPGSSVTITNNQIYKRFTDQYLNLFYTLVPPDYYVLSYDFSEVEDNPNYTVTHNSIYEFGAYTLPLPIPRPPKIGQANVATSAEVTASSGADTAVLARDGMASTEWISTEAMPWIRFTWDEVQTIDAVRLFDRADLAHWCTSGDLTFSDGSNLHLTGGILNNGAMREVRFDAKTVTWMQFNVTRSTGDQNGLTEMQVFAAGPASPPPSPPDAGDFIVDFQDRPTVAARLSGEYPHGKNGINWKYADWTTRSTEGRHYAYLNWPNSDYAWRMFVLPKGKVLKSLKLSGPPGSVVNCSMIGQRNGVSFSPTPPFTVYETGWTLPPFTNIVAMTIDTIAAPGSDITTVKIDDITFGDVDPN